jgi:hypothetical protein
MILVDTSVLIGYLKGQTGLKINLFANIMSHGIPYGFSAYTYLETLQGARDERELKQLREYLATESIYFLPETLAIYEKAALLHYNLRRHGVTVRGSVDALIALTAIEHKLLLLHDDRDFDGIAKWTPELNILESL